ncbi:GNAT family N-acetyltransferase [Gracilibacillus alcaliphilus]|uniref:GNAT family N-acetyltransferase n=1 Tax=Gracilibacillus alcaliphilus TaxID=1401441 RepID=UPI001EF8B6D2|nr:N-acetyltransferase [Gracilibacillus alcaliphilus]MBM7679244.1 ribosomal protein S18 acetylase RimI-like enzyme [Gracilibacillus alcaliphilus]
MDKRRTIANHVFTKEFQQAPLKTGEGIGNVGFVVTAPDYQRQGVAFRLMQYLLDLPGYQTYMLEAVADTNTAALALYEKLGYQEFRRIKQKHSKWSGINYYIDMKYEKK